MTHRTYIVLLLLCLLSGMQGTVCATSQSSPFTFHVARQTLAAADSMRVNEGRLYDDSLALVEAYATTGKWRYIYPNDYARACYYYGYMLRQHGDQVAAMQAFIAGTHAPYIQRVVPLPWFSNYHILGRIYTNMGTMCHLVDEFQLGYDMYEQSAKSFYRAGDTTLYYYGLNAMALELAEQGMHNETLALLDSIEQECTDSGVLTKLWETKAILYLNLEKYDSTIYAVGQLQSRGNYEPTGYVKKAQAYWALQQYDSALYYAKFIKSSPYASKQDKYHMLYILISHDSINTTQEVQALSAERADLNSEHIEPLLQRLSAAVELLKQHLENRPSPQKNILAIIMLSFVATAVGIIMAKFKKEIVRLFNRNRQLKKENDAIRQSNENIKQQHAAREQQIVQDIENTCVIIRRYTNWNKKIHWKDYSALCEFINQHFYLLADKLKLIYHLDEKEIRLCILVLLEMDNKSIAQVIHYAPNGIGKYKYRIAQKLSTNIKNLRDCLIEIVVGT